MTFEVIITDKHKVVARIEDNGTTQVVVLSATDAYRLGEALRDKADQVMDDTTGYLMDNEMRVPWIPEPTIAQPEFVKPWMVWPKGDLHC